MGRHCHDGPARADSPDTWTDALLFANGHSMLSADWGYGLEDNGDAVLVRRLETQQESEQILAVQLGGLLAMCQATREGVLALGEASQRKGAVQ